MKKKTVVFTTLGAFASLILLILSAYAIIIYNMPDFSSVYGIAKISVSGRQLYFKREARGLNYDSVVLSANDNFCDKYNPESDFRFTTADPVIYYKIDSDTLYLLSGNPASGGSEHKPDDYVVAAESFSVKVVIVRPDRLIDWEKRGELYQDREMKLLEIPLDDNLKCGF